MNTISKKRHEQSIELALNILCNQPFVQYIEAIYLYGSCARGEQRYDSDVDILVQCNENFTPQIGRAMRISAMPDNIEIPEVELKFVYGNSWRKKTDQYSINLQKEGRLLWQSK